MLFKNPISLLLLFLSLLGLLFLGSCEKDSFLPNSVEKVAFNSLSESNKQTKVKHVVASKSLQQSIKSGLLSNFEKSDEEKDAAFSAILDVILASPASKTSSDTLDYDVYSYFVPTEDPTHVVNAVFSVKNDSLTGGYVYVFRMTSEFATGFNSFSVDFSQFEGELGIRPLASLKELIYEPGQKNGDDDCFTYILSLEPTIPDGGGGGDGGVTSGGGKPTSTTGPVVGGGGAGDGGPRCLVFTFLPCTCSPNHQIGINEEECECGDHGGGGEHPTLEITECNPDETFSPDTNPTTSTTNKDLNLEDCTRLLASVGIVPRRLSLPDASESTFAQISAAIKETCYDERAVMDMIDPAAFEACYDLGTPGPTCITEQVISFLNGRNYPSGSIPGTSISNVSISFDGMPHDQLAPFLHAAVAANGNEHALAGIYHTRRRLSNPLIEQNIATSIILFSKLSLSSPDDELESNTSKLNSILENCEFFPETDDALSLINDLSKLESVYQISQSYPLSSMDYFLRIADHIPNFDEIIDEISSVKNLIDNNFVEEHEELIDSDVSISFIGQLPRDQFVNYPKLAKMTRVLDRVPPAQNPNNINHPLIGSMADLPEDLRWGSDGKIDGIHNLDLEIDELEEHLEDLMRFMSTAASSEIKTVKNAYFDRFVLRRPAQDNFEDYSKPEIGDYEFDDLTSTMMQTPEVSNAISRFVENNLENELKRHQGDINQLMQEGLVIFPEAIRPKFSSYKFSGLAIIMNDVESIDLRIVPEQSQINTTTGEYSFVLAVQFVDNFGLDYRDVIKYQSIESITEININTTSIPDAIRTIWGEREDIFRAIYGDGFSSWYVLQHKKNYKPFRSNVTFQVGVTGNYLLD